MPQEIHEQAKIEKVAESIVSVDGALQPEAMVNITLSFASMDRHDYLRLARAWLVGEPVWVSIATSQSELPLEPGLSEYGARVMPMPGVVQ